MRKGKKALRVVVARRRHRHSNRVEQSPLALPEVSGKAAEYQVVRR
jgi:hypothetical protein